MDTFLNFIKKSWKILLFVIIIHVSLILADFNNFFHGKFVADWLGYFGSLIGAAISIYGIYWTLQDSRKQLEEQREEERYKIEEQHRKEIMPFITLSNTVGGLTRDGLFSDKVKTHGKYAGKRLREPHRIYSVKFDDYPDNTKHFYLVFDVKNVGLGTGMITQIEIYDKATKELKYTSKKVSDYNDINTVLMLANVGEINKLMLRLDRKVIFQPITILIKCYFEDLVLNRYYFEKEIEIFQHSDPESFEFKGLKNKKPVQFNEQNEDSE